MRLFTPTVSYLRKGCLVLVVLCLQMDLFGQLNSIQHISKPVVVDGQLTEWDDFQTLPISSLPRYANQVKYALGWDKEHLYVALDIRDARLCVNEVGDDNPKLYFSDAFEIYIDSKADSEQSMDLNDYQFLISISGDKTIFKGNKLLMLDGARVPKDYEGTNIVVHTGIDIRGTLNDERDIDAGYTAEMAIPWSAIGIEAAQGVNIKMDLCIDDVDTLSSIRQWPENLHPPCLNYSSVTGHNDFGFPQYWLRYQLAGKPGLAFSVRKVWHDLPVIVVLALAMVFALMIYAIIIQYRKITFLKALPDKTSWQNWKENHPTISKEEKTNNPLDIQIENETMDTIRSFVSAHLDQDISVAELANHMHKSVRQLQRICKLDTGLTPLQLITILKLEKAAERILKSNATIAEIAYEHGFSDPSYFGNVFRKYHGITPMEFRQKNGVGR